MTKNEWQRLRIFLASVPKNPRGIRSSRFYVVLHCPEAEKWVYDRRKTLDSVRGKPYEDHKKEYKRVWDSYDIEWRLRQKLGKVSVTLRVPTTKIDTDCLRYAKGKKLIYRGDIKRIELDWTDYEGITHRF